MSKPTGLVDLPPGAAAIPWKSGRFYYAGSHLFSWASSSTLALAAARLYAMPILVPPGSRADQITAYITSFGAAGKLIKLGLYTVGSDGLPGLLLEQSGDLPADATQAKQYTIGQKGPGMYYVTAISDGTPTLFAYAGTGIVNPFGEATLSSKNIYAGVYLDVAYGALPGAFGTPTGYITTPWPGLGMRAA